MSSKMYSKCLIFFICSNVYAGEFDNYYVGKVIPNERVKVINISVWKKLKEDYISTHIFNTSFYVLVAILIVHLVAKNFFQASWFWLTFSGIGVGLTLGIVRYRLRIFETLEGATISLLPWLGLVFLSDSIVNSSLRISLKRMKLICQGYG